MKGRTWTIRPPANAALYDLAPPPTATRPARLGAPTSADPRPGRDCAWQQAGVLRDGRTDTIQIAIVDCIWTSFGNAEGRRALVRDQDSAKAYDLALFTLDPAASTAQVVERYAVRWSIEPSNAAGKQQMGAGQARNRVKNAVERTVPFAMLIQSMVIVWYGLHGYDPTTSPPVGWPSPGTTPRPSRPSRTCSPSSAAS